MEIDWYDNAGFDVGAMWTIDYSEKIIYEKGYKVDDDLIKKGLIRFSIFDKKIKFEILSIECRALKRVFF